VKIKLLLKTKKKIKLIKGNLIFLQFKSLLKERKNLNLHPLIFLYFQIGFLVINKLSE